MTANEKIFIDYRRFLENLVRNRSTQRFSNGGAEFASILMSVLLNNTSSTVRIYCNGFGPELVCMQDYQAAFKEFLNKTDKKLMLLVRKGDKKNEAPLQWVREVQSQREDNSIQVKVISQSAEERIKARFLGECNFAIFDEDKYRMEYDPTNYKAFGSFNEPEVCKLLTEEFDAAFKESPALQWN